MTGMGISVRGYLTFKPLIGKRNVDTGPDGMTLKELLGLLKREIGEDFEVVVADVEKKVNDRSIVILVNGRNLEKGLNTQLKEGDEIAIFPPMAGG